MIKDFLSKLFSAPPAPIPVAAPVLVEPDAAPKLAQLRRDFTGKTLGQKQRMLPPMIAALIVFAYERGYEVTFGDAYRDPRVHGAVGVKSSYSAASSVHKERLAVDLNLFRDGRYLTSTEDHAELGVFWEGMGGTWGGRFNDGNHYSIEHGGRK